MNIARCGGKADYSLQLTRIIPSYWLPRKEVLILTCDHALHSSFLVLLLAPSVDHDTPANDNDQDQDDNDVDGEGRTTILLSHGGACVATCPRRGQLLSYYRVYHQRYACGNNQLTWAILDLAVSMYKRSYELFIRQSGRLPNVVSTWCVPCNFSSSFNFYLLLPICLATWSVRGPWRKAKNSMNTWKLSVSATNGFKFILCLVIHECYSTFIFFYFVKHLIYTL